LHEKPLPEHGLAAVAAEPLHGQAKAVPFKPVAVAVLLSLIGPRAALAHDRAKQPVAPLEVMHDATDRHVRRWSARMRKMVAAHVAEAGADEGERILALPDRRRRDHALGEK